MYPDALYINVCMHKYWKAEDGKGRLISLKSVQPNEEGKKNTLIQMWSRGMHC